MAGYLLELRDVHTYVGLAYILRGVSLTVQEGEAVALLGRNGEGKTPTIKTIMSVLPPRKGEIYFQGENITGLPTHEVAGKGIGLVPKGRHIFPALNVLEHLRVPVADRKVNRNDALKRVFEMFPELEPKKYQSARSLSGGEQQMLVIGRAMMMIPKLLLLDEPLEGLAPVAVRRVVDAMRAAQARGVTVLFASASCERALSVAQQAYIMVKGRIVYQGACEELQADRETQQKYLGVRE